MFFGQWTDAGEVHRKGMADLLLTPTVNFWPCLISQYGLDFPLLLRDMHLKVTVPLWVECKSGRGKLEPEQIAFRDHVQKSKNFYLQAHDCADVVIEWFNLFGVIR
jgi:hypothetical protein